MSLSNWDSRIYEHTLKSATASQFNSEFPNRAAPIFGQNGTSESTRFSGSFHPNGKLCDIKAVSVRQDLPPSPWILLDRGKLLYIETITDSLWDFFKLRPGEKGNKDGITEVGIMRLEKSIGNFMRSNIHSKWTHNNSVSIFGNPYEAGRFLFLRPCRLQSNRSCAH